MIGMIGTPPIARSCRSVIASACDRGARLDKTAHVCCMCFSPHLPRYRLFRLLRAEDWEMHLVAEGKLQQPGAHVDGMLHHR